MKNRTYKKLTLNKERISELSVKNMGIIKGGESQINDICWQVTYGPACSGVTCVDDITNTFCEQRPVELTYGFFC